MTPPVPTIHKALRRLLKTAWDADAGSAWHLTTHTERRKFRQVDPVVGSTFEAEELAALACIPLFAGLIGEDGTTVNAGAEDALVDFCRDTYAAFAKLKGRVAELREPVAK